MFTKTIIAPFAALGLMAFSMGSFGFVANAQNVCDDSAQSAYARAPRC